MRIDKILPIAKQRMITISDNASLVDAAGLLCETHVALLVVCNSNGIMVGVITKTDIVRQVAQHQGQIDNIKVSGVMIKSVTHCQCEDLLEDVLALMKIKEFVHIPIIDEKSRPCGVVNARDALQALLKEVKDDKSLLYDYIMGVGYH